MKREDAIQNVIATLEADALGIRYPTEARPYAKAAFDFAQEKGVLTEWSVFLSLASRLMTLPEMVALLNHPKCLSDQKAQFFIDLLKTLLSNFKDLSFVLTKEQENFLHLLGRYNRFVLLPSIHGLYNAFLAALHKTLAVKIYVAFPLESGQQTRLEQTLEKRFRCKIDVTYEEDKSLLGGALLLIEDEVIDASIRGRLAQFKHLFCSHSSSR